VFVVVFSPNGKMLATSSWVKKINVYSVANDFSCMQTMEGHTKSIYSLSSPSDSTRLVSAGYDESIRLWDPTAGSLLKTVDNAHTNSITAITNSPNENLIASGSYDSTIKIWDAKTLKLKFVIFDAHSDGVNDLCFTTTGPFLLSASDDSTVKVIKIALLDSYQKRFPVLLAYLRFNDTVDESEEVEEVKKFANARRAYDTKIRGRAAAVRPDWMQA